MSYAVKLLIISIPTCISYIITKLAIKHETVYDPHLVTPFIACIFCLVVTLAYSSEVGMKKSFKLFGRIWVLIMLGYSLALTIN